MRFSTHSSILLLLVAVAKVQGQGVNFCDVYVEQCLDVLIDPNNSCDSGDAGSVTYCLQDKDTTGCMLDGASECVCKSDSGNSETYSHINIYVDGVDLEANSADLSSTGFADTCNDIEGSSKGCGLVDSSGTDAQGVKYETTKGGGLCVTVPLAADLTHPKIVFGVKDRGSCDIAFEQGNWACSSDCHCGGGHACIFETGTSCPELPDDDTEAPMRSCRDYGGITDPTCYDVTCAYNDGDASTPASIQFSKIDGDSCFCKDWSYFGWGREENQKVESGLVPNTDITVPSGASGNTFEVKSATTCFDVTCAADGSSTIASKSSCELSGGPGGNGNGNGNGGGNDNGNGRGPPCFSGNTVLKEQVRGDIFMKDLQVGDKVLTGKNKYEPVYSFGHYHESMVDKFFEIHTAESKKPLEMTGNHLIFVLNTEGRQQTLRVDQLQVGDLLLLAGAKQSSTRVTKITDTKQKGLYMPLTPDGTIVADGIVASTYVSFQEEAPMFVETASGIFHMSEQFMMHLWLSPYRMLCMGVSSSLCKAASQYNQEDGILQWLHAGRMLVQHGETGYGFWSRVFLLGVPLLFIFTILFAVEMFFGAALAPLGVLSLGSLVYKCYWRNHDVTSTGKKIV